MDALRGAGATAGVSLGPAFRRLRRLPELFHFLQRGVGGVLPLLRQYPLHGPEAPLELRVRRAEAVLGVQVQLPRQVRHHKEQVAQLIGEAPQGAPAPPTQLRSLAERLGLPVFAEHDALGDALTTAQVFLAQATWLEQRGAGTLRGLLRAGGV